MNNEDSEEVLEAMFKVAVTEIETWASGIFNLPMGLPASSYK